MAMGERGMADMTEMQMPLPANTLPMMAGQGPYGAIGMGGMFSLLKVRPDQAAADYRDPGWFTPPAGTVATEYQGPLPAPHSAEAAMPGTVDLTVKKPGQHSH